MVVRHLDLATMKLPHHVVRKGAYLGDLAHGAVRDLQVRVELVEPVGELLESVRDGLTFLGLHRSLTGTMKLRSSTLAIGLEAVVMRFVTL